MFSLHTHTRMHAHSHTHTHTHTECNLDLSFPDVSFSQIHLSVSVVPYQILFYVGLRVYHFHVFIVLFQDPLQK
jgi:hypothetical protein